MGPTPSSSPTSLLMAFSPTFPANNQLDRSLTRKRVMWSPSIEGGGDKTRIENYYRRGLTEIESETECESETDAIQEPCPSHQPSKGRQPGRSILKPFDPARLSIKADLKLEWPALVDASLCQLKSNERSTLLEAYMTLNGAFGTRESYFDDDDNVSEPVADDDSRPLQDPIVIQLLLDRAEPLMRAIQRDTFSELSFVDQPDAYLIHQAMTLLINIHAHYPNLFEREAQYLRLPLMQRAVSLVERSRRTRRVLRCCIRLMTISTFSAGIVTSEQADRIITFLTAWNGVGRKSGMTTGSRLDMYKVLVKEAPQRMIDRSQEWLGDMLDAIMDPQASVRKQALALGSDVARLGTASPVSRTIQDLLAQPVGRFVLRPALRPSIPPPPPPPSHLPFPETYAARLQRHLTEAVNHHGGRRVPTHWSNIVMLLRSRPRQLDEWAGLDDWMHIIQGCFNAKDRKIQASAHRAWQQFIFAVHPDEHTAPAILNMLRQPIVGFLGPRVLPRYCHRALCEAARSSLSCLFYYAFRPAATWQRLDTFWDAYVGGMLVPSILPNKRETDAAINLLAGLFADTASSGRRPWRVERVHEAEAISVEEMPRLDVEWVRSRTPRILPVCSLVLRSGSWVGDRLAESVVGRFWRHFIQCLADAGRTERGVSRPEMEATYGLTGFLIQIWRDGLVGLGGAAARGSAKEATERFVFLLTTAVTALGPAFARPFLIRQGETVVLAGGDGDVWVDSLASRRPTTTKTNNEDSGPARGPVRSPVAVLLEHLSFDDDEIAPTIRPYHQAATALLTTAGASCPTMRARLQLVLDCIGYLHAFTAPGGPNGHNRDTWKVIAEGMTSIMTMSIDPAVDVVDGIQGIRQAACTTLLEYGSVFGDRRSVRVRRGLADAMEASLREPRVVTGRERRGRPHLRRRRRDDDDDDGGDDDSHNGDGGSEDEPAPKRARLGGPDQTIEPTKTTRVAHRRRPMQRSARLGGGVVPVQAQDVDMVDVTAVVPSGAVVEEELLSQEPPPAAPEGHFAGLAGIVQGLQGMWGQLHRFLF